MNQERPSRILLFIGLFKLLKGALLMATAFELHHLLHKDVRSVVMHWVNLLRIDPHNHHLAGLLGKLGWLDARHLKELSALSAFYAVIFLCEGTGLCLQKRWGEYFSIIITCSFLPFELHEVARKPDLARILLLLGNIAIVWYLVVRLRRKPSAEPGK